MADTDAIPVPPDVNRGGEILTVCGTLVALSLVVVALRIWVRARMIRQVGLDDWTMIAAMVRLQRRIIPPASASPADRHNPTDPSLRSPRTNNLVPNHVCVYRPSCSSR